MMTAERLIAMVVIVGSICSMAEAFDPFVVEVCLPSHISGKSNFAVKLIVAEGMIVGDLQGHIVKVVETINSEDFANFKIAIKSAGVVCNSEQKVTNVESNGGRDFCYIKEPERREFQVDNSVERVRIIQTNQCKPKDSGVVLAFWHSMSNEEKQVAKTQFEKEMEVGNDNIDFTEEGLYKRYMQDALICGAVSKPCDSLPDTPSDGTRPVMLIVLGPSASGKTRSTSTYIDQVLEANRKSPRAF
mmetsp:Transcript_3606/g.8544  ORF Transcript_3606/g.8544 Transcript_3606/m.8544 type:complete len:245 (-) Transcript_3606:59-793(-)